MKTLQEIKDEVAIEEGFTSYSHYINSNAMPGYTEYTEYVHEQIANKFAEQCLREAAERATVKGIHQTVPTGITAKVAYPHQEGWEISVDKESILSLIKELK